MRLLYTFLLLLATAGAHAQIAINSIRTAPANPTTATPIKVAVTVVSSTLGQLLHSQWQRTGDTLYINNCYSRGIAQLVITYTDTIAVGLMPAGRYIIKASAKAAYIPADCQASAVISRQTKALLVSSTLATAPGRPGNGWMLYPQPTASRRLYLERPDAVMIRAATLLDATGRPCFNSLGSTLATHLTFDLPASLAAGSYVLRLFQADGSISNLHVALL